MARSVPTGTRQALWPPYRNGLRKEDTALGREACASAVDGTPQRSPVAVGRR